MGQFFVREPDLFRFFICGRVQLKFRKSRSNKHHDSSRQHYINTQSFLRAVCIIAGSKKDLTLDSITYSQGTNK